MLIQRKDSLWYKVTQGSCPSQASFLSLMDHFVVISRTKNERGCHNEI